MPKDEEKFTREYASVVQVLPSGSQIEQFQKTFGCARFVYNHFLNMRKTLFQHTGAGSDRTWICPTCGAEYERDANASLNLLVEGLRLSLS